MEGARYLEDGKLTVFRDQAFTTPGSAYRRRQVYFAVAEDLERAGRCRSRPQVTVPNRTEAEQGLPPKSKLFAAVIDDYIGHRGRDHRHGKTSAGMLRQIVRVSKFWREYAGHLAVEVIDQQGDA